MGVFALIDKKYFSLKMCVNRIKELASVEILKEASIRYIKDLLSFLNDLQLLCVCIYMYMEKNIYI